ncbi:MAG: hypothetical protein ACUVTX_05740 [Bacteroidales bacterium]
MEDVHMTEINKSRKILLLSAIIFILLFVLYYIILSFIVPAARVSSINNEYGNRKHVKGGLNDTILSDSVYVALNRQRAFYQARIAMAASDSVALSVNLPDSIITLEINGVPVYTTIITWSRISNVFRKADEYAVSMMLSSPFTISNDYSSIRKEPLIHKIAPRDTTEYKPGSIPDTSRIEYANFILESKEGIKLYVYQKACGNFKAVLHRFLFSLADRIRTSAYTVKCMVLFRKPQYKPFVKTEVPLGDARIIYRALPKHGKFAIYR